MKKQTAFYLLIRWMLLIPILIVTGQPPKGTLIFSPHITVIFRYVDILVKEEKPSDLKKLL